MILFKLGIAKIMFHYNQKSDIETTEHSQITTIKQLHHHNTRLSSQNNYRTFSHVKEQKQANNH